MDITSLIITFVGIIIILALYIISRISRTKFPQSKSAKLPNLKNDDGSAFTSVLDDIPAQDGSTPKPKQEKIGATPKKDIDASSQKNTPKQAKTKSEPVKQKQHILFISSNDAAGLDGNLVKKVLNKNGLAFGDLDIYHYLIEAQTDNGLKQISLFRVANGVDPWTLKNENLYNKKLAGLSIVLLTPCEIDSEEAIKTFVTVSHKVSLEVNGVLKNQLQQVFTPKDEALLLDSV